MAGTVETLGNYVGGKWHTPNAQTQDVRNPATGDTLARVPLSSRSDVNDAVAAAVRAWDGWRRTPPTDRIQYLFKLRQLLEDNFDDLARTITMEAGKTLSEAKGEMRRGVENVETAAGIPTLSMGYNVEDIASGIDEIMIRQPLGVVGVVNGGKEAVDGLLDHPDIRAISFVGSSPVAQYVYQRAAAAGKRVQCQGGAKNPIVIMPDADMDMTVRMAADSAFGCAGQRCLAASIVIPIGEARETFTPRMLETAAARKVGYGLDEGVEMGPVITPQSRERIAGLVDAGLKEGGRVLVDGRRADVAGYKSGNFLKPTVVETANPGGTIATTEIFGPVLALSEMKSLDEAIEAVNRSAYGNMACIFTSSGAAARKFRYEVRAGNVGVNIGVAAPMAFFPFSGWKGSFFGDLHAQGHDAVEFYMDKKVVVERWPKEWSRTF